MNNDDCHHAKLSNVFTDYGCAGYLGAGKTTLLNYILKEKHGKKIAVIMNGLFSSHLKLIPNMINGIFLEFGDCMLSRSHLCYSMIGGSGCQVSMGTALTGLLGSYSQ